MRWRLLGVVAGLASAASLAYANGGTAVPSRPLDGRVPGRASSHRYRIVIEPSFQAGEAGWASYLSYRGGGGEGGGGGYPTAGWPFFGGGSGFSPYSSAAPNDEVVDYVLTGPNVAALRVGKQTILTFTDPRLPAGDRAAVFFRRVKSPVVILPGLGGRRAARIVPLDSAGHVIPAREAPPPPIFGLRFWQAPSAITPNVHEAPYHGPKHPLPGACELRQQGLGALKPVWGHVISRIRPVTGSQGEVFLSCIDTEYYLHGWPLEVSVLLDAAQPGQTLGAIPGARPVNGHLKLVNLAAGQFPGSLTAQRVGQAWLVVQGGASLEQRLRVLRALRITKLDF
jgi:hypothetical protein